MAGSGIYTKEGSRYNKHHNAKAEVLAPAGSLDICKAVINAGADAVYLGGDMFGARAYAGNLNQEEMFEALDYAHMRNRQIYLTVNTLLKQGEIDGQLIDYLIPYYRRGLDAVIVQDLGVMRLIREHFPDMDIHASTQMTQTGEAGAGLLYKAGVRRVVTSREMTLDEIAALHKAYPDMEIESFVHGALCYCYSGQCLMSSFNGGRSGNRGRCAQPCRLPYKVYDKQELINSTKEGYALSPKDMCALKILPEIMAAGVYSLKIEGRMKNVTYAAYVTAIYRKYVDMYLAEGKSGYKIKDKDIVELCDIYNRGAFTTGFYNSKKGREMMALTRPNHWGVRALQVVSNIKGKVTFKALTDINPQDVFEIDREHSFESGSYVKKGQTLTVNLPRKYELEAGKVLNRTKNAYLTEYVKKNYVESTSVITVNMYFKALKNENAQLTVNVGDVYATAYGNITGQADKRAATIKDIKDKLAMTGQTGFTAGDIEVDIDNDIFMPVSELKRLRREALGLLGENMLDMYKREYSAAAEKKAAQIIASNEVAAVSYSKSVYMYNVKYIDTILGIKAVKRVYIDFEIFYNDRKAFYSACTKVTASKTQLYIGLPYILTHNKHQVLQQLLDDIEAAANITVDGYLVRNIEEIGLLSERNKLHVGAGACKYSIITDAGLYIFNTYAKQELKDIVSKAGLDISLCTLPYELNASEQRPVGSKDTELIVYGRIPAMVSKQCVRKTYGRCDHNASTTVLKQDKGMEYHVKSVCSFCYTITWADTFDISGEEVLEGMFLGSVRYEFDTESQEQILNILDNNSGITYKGHFYRGVN